MALLYCLSCKKSNSVVINSRGDGETISRRRKCNSCGFRWSTYEVSLVKEIRKAKPRLMRTVTYNVFREAKQ